MDKRYSFNEDVVNYDKWRPKYVQKMFEDIIGYAEVNADKRVIEIGIGTGQATEPFLKTGCSLTAIELGEGLAGFTKEKFRAYPNLKVKNTSFEDFESAENSVDLIYSATAFHWISEEIGYTKVFNMLKSGGTLALFWNRPFVSREDDALHQEIQKLYEKFRPDAIKPVENDTGRYERIKKSILAAGFVSLEFKLYHNVRHFDADAYIALLNTYSDRRDLSADTKHAFEKELKNAIAAHGNELAVYDTIDLYLSQKP